MIRTRVCCLDDERAGRLNVRSLCDLWEDIFEMNLKAECHEIGRRNHVHSVSFAYCGNRGRVPVEPLVHEILYYS